MKLHPLARPAAVRRSRRSAVIVAAAATLLGGAAVVALPTTSQARDLAARSTVRAADGTVLGTVRFVVSGDKTRVRAHLSLPAGLGGWNAFHGFHIHANDKPANGSGCIADPALAPASWFVSADGHLSDLGQVHGAHRGDLPSLLVNADGTADIRFTTQRLSVGDLQDRVVVVHADPDNFDNIPVGAGPDQYTANSPTAITKSGATGNAGDRIGCGVITLDK